LKTHTKITFLGRSYYQRKAKPEPQLTEEHVNPLELHRKRELELSHSEGNSRRWNFGCTATYRPV